MNPRVPYGVRYKYPHMKPNDIAIWERFVLRHPEEYKEVIYDQPLGAGRQTPEDVDENMAADWKILTQWKVDVIGFKEGSIEVIEVKPNAGPSALGQIMAYAILVDKIDELSLPVIPVILTDVERPEMRKICEEMGVHLIIEPVNP